MKQKAEISNFIAGRIGANDFPSAVYLVAEKGEIVFQDALGFAVVEPEKIEATIETIYDLASLTKVLVAGLLCAKLLDQNEIALDDKISKFFPEFETDEKRDITIQNLLTHTSGFVAWLPIYLLSDSKFQIPDSILPIIFKEPCEVAPDSKVIYSDLNFILLGFLLEKLHKKSLDEITKAEISEKLNLENTFFNPPKQLQKQIAASEFGNEYEKQTCQSLFPNLRLSPSAFRLSSIWGEVHDGNCCFMRGVSGHAGLFSTVAEVFKIARQFLPHSTQLLKPETCQLFRTNFTPNMNEARSLAFQLAATPDSTAGKTLAKDSFGHLGFTGTSLWIEPETERIFILLTNRTHAHELPFVNINSTRRKFHELATKLLNERK